MSWQVMTWNVLHRIHGVNWGETVMELYPEEPERIAKITAFVAAELAAGVDACCLQEVSGDQLQYLRAQLPEGTSLFHHHYPRIPSLRSGGASPLSDPSEHLVTLVRGAARRVTSGTFPSDPGKGFLAVVLEGGLTVFNAHISFGHRGQEQLRVLLGMAQSSGLVAVVGDFNAPLPRVRVALGPTPDYADVTGQLPTRIPEAGKPGKHIDHVVAWQAKVEQARVLDIGCLSDHNPVRAQVTPVG